MPEISVGSRVVFVGPEYRWQAGDFVMIGDKGTVIARDGSFAEPIGEPRTELVTIKFDRGSKPAVVGIERIQLA